MPRDLRLIIVRRVRDPLDALLLLLVGLPEERAAFVKALSLLSRLTLPLPEVQNDFFPIFELQQQSGVVLLRSLSAAKCTRVPLCALSTHSVLDVEDALRFDVKDMHVVSWKQAQLVLVEIKVVPGENHLVSLLFAALTEAVAAAGKIVAVATLPLYVLLLLEETLGKLDGRVGCNYRVDAYECVIRVWCEIQGDSRYPVGKACSDFVDLELLGLCRNPPRDGLSCHESVMLGSVSPGRASSTLALSSFRALEQL